MLHILNHHIWPDSSPVCLYAEQVALDLHKKGIPVRMVGGTNQYRKVKRPKPRIDLIRLKTVSQPRQNHRQILAEYISIFVALKKYLQTEVKTGDLVLVTSTPFLNVFLISALIRKKAKSIYWLSDYYPESLTSLGGIYRFLSPVAKAAWPYWLAKWDTVIKVADNLGYTGDNAVIYRLWPTTTFSQSETAKSSNKRAALFAGNLGITHDVNAFTKICRKLKGQGYSLSIFADGPGVSLLPAWIPVKPPNNSEAQLKKLYLSHDVHIVVGTKDNDKGSFPSKLWNSLAAGKEIKAVGFKGKMKRELDAAKSSNFKMHRQKLVDFISRAYQD